VGRVAHSRASVFAQSINLRTRTSLASRAALSNCSEQTTLWGSMIGNPSVQLTATRRASSTARATDLNRIAWPRKKTRRDQAEGEFYTTQLDQYLAEDFVSLREEYFSTSRRRIFEFASRCECVFRIGRCRQRTVCVKGSCPGILTVKEL
jgi:hypothetical protein